MPLPQPLRPPPLPAVPATRRVPGSVGHQWENVCRLSALPWPGLHSSSSQAPGRTRTHRQAHPPTWYSSSSGRGKLHLAWLPRIARAAWSYARAASCMGARGGPQGALALQHLCQFCPVWSAGERAGSCCHSLIDRTTSPTSFTLPHRPLPCQTFPASDVRRRLGPGSLLPICPRGAGAHPGKSCSCPWLLRRRAREAAAALLAPQATAAQVPQACVAVPCVRAARGYG